MKTELYHAVRHPVSLGTALCLLAGCSFVPAYKPPAVNLPTVYRAAPPNNAPTIAADVWPKEDWWRGFTDPELDRLEDLARVHNDNILIAIAQVKEADGAAREAGSALLPGLSLGGTQNWQQSTQSAQLGALGLGGIGGPGGSTSGSSSATTDNRSYGLTASLSYQIDFWGKNRATAKAADYTLLASRYSQANVALTVETSVATAYFQAMADADELAVADSNLDLARQTLDVYQGRLDAGTATALDVAQQQATVAEQQAAIPADQSALEQELVALGILVGKTPEELNIVPGTLTSLAVPTVTAGLPSQLLARRPDVADAEANLLAANQNIGVARAAFFPAFNLTGSSGFESQALNKLLVPGALDLSLGSSFTQVIFDNGQLTGQLEAAHGQYEQSAATYHQAMLQALTDVEDALIGLRYTTEQERLQQIAYDISARANDIAHEQMEAGTVDITTVLNTENTLRSNQLTLVQVRLSRFNALITLFKALGGGWSNSDLAAMKG